MIKSFYRSCIEVQVPDNDSQQQKPRPLGAQIPWSLYNWALKQADVGSIGRITVCLSNTCVFAQQLTSLYAQALDLCHQILKPALLKARNASFLGSVLTWVQGALKLSRSKHQSIV